MSDMVNVTIRVDKKTKEEADQLFHELGINFNTAVKVFLKASLRCKGLPFRIAEDPKIIKP